MRTPTGRTPNLSKQPAWKKFVLASCGGRGEQDPRYQVDLHSAESIAACHAGGMPDPEGPKHPNLAHVRFLPQRS